MARKLKMTKKCIAARKRYRAKNGGVPARRKNRKRGAGTLGEWFARGRVTKGPIMTGLRGPPKRKYGLGIKHKYVIQGKKRYPLKRRISPGKYNLMTGKMGSGLRRKRKRRGRGRGRGRGAKGAGFWEDLGHTMETIGTTALSILPMIL